MEREYKNVEFFFLAFFALVMLGFYKPYFGLFPHFDKTINAVVHIHATALILWVVLLVVQPALIRYKKISFHRLLGRFTYFLVPLIIVSSIAVMNKQYNEGIEQKMTHAESLKTLFIPFAELLLFTSFYILAIVHKLNVAFHMRYIICTALILITPSLARVTGFWFDIRQFSSYRISFLVSDFIVIILILFDRQKKLNYQPYFVALILFLIFHISWYLLGHPF
jgi:hypothetical protein